jgi:serine/threonine protein phosphatase PrpC
MEKLSQSLIEWGSAESTLIGQIVSGDRYLVKALPGGVLVAVMDGIGHGEQAAAAAQAAVKILNDSTKGSLMGMMRECHEHLRGTRGVVMSLASIDGVQNTLTWMGVGNVEGVLFHQDAVDSPTHETLLLRGGVVGDTLPRLQASILPITKGDLLVFATDGVNPEFAETIILNEHPQTVADRILAMHIRKNDDALVLVAQYLNEHPRTEGL